MEKRGSAYFVAFPRTIEDLMVPHLVEQERQYEIIRVVKLAKIDYENFVADMIVERQFLEDHVELFVKGEEWKCILVRKERHSDGVLVMPMDGGYVGWAAYYCG